MKNIMFFSVFLLNQLISFLDKYKINLKSDSTSELEQQGSNL